MSLASLLNGHAFTPDLPDLSHPLAARVRNRKIALIQVAMTDVVYSVMAFDGSGKLVSVTEPESVPGTVSGTISAWLGKNKGIAGCLLAATELSQADRYSTTGAHFDSDLDRADMLRRKGGIERVVGARISTDEARFYSAITHPKHVTHLVFAWAERRIRDAIDSIPPSLPIVAYLSLPEAYVHALAQTNPDAFMRNDFILRSGDHLLALACDSAGNWVRAKNDIAESKDEIVSHFREMAGFGLASSGALRPVRFIDFGGAKPIPPEAMDTLAPGLVSGEAGAEEFCTLSALRLICEKACVASLDLQPVFAAPRRVLPAGAAALPKVGLALCALSIVAAGIFGWRMTRVQADADAVTAQVKKLNDDIVSIGAQRAVLGANVAIAENYAHWRMGDRDLARLTSLFATTYQGCKVNNFIAMMTDSGVLHIEADITPPDGKPASAFVSDTADSFYKAVEAEFGYKPTLTNGAEHMGKVEFRADLMPSN